MSDGGDEGRGTLVPALITRPRGLAQRWFPGPRAQAKIGEDVGTVLLGAATGLRSLAAPSQLSRRVRRRKSPVMDEIEWLGNPWLHRLLRLAAIGEMVADKLPLTPARIAPGPLLGRVLLGAGSGAGVARLHGGSLTRGAVLGGLGAAVGAYAGYHVRRILVQSGGLPDPAVALCEDVVAVGLARAALRRRRCSPIKG